MAEIEPVSINPDILYKIKYNGVLIGFCLHHIAYITNPELANMYDASILFYKVDKLYTDELELIQETDSVCIDAADVLEDLLHCAETSRDTIPREDEGVLVSMPGRITACFRFKDENTDGIYGTVKLIKECENNDRI